MSYTLESGEYEGEDGFWIEDEEGNEGFVGKDTFWGLEDHGAFKVLGQSLRTG